MNRGLAAAFVPQTDLGETGLAVHTPRRRGWRRVAAAAVALAGLVAGLSPAPAAGPAEPPVPVLDWQPCAEPAQHGFDCATAQVPLDYGDPQGATIDLAVVRHPATDPAQRLGTLFFNPGGPAGPGTVLLPQWLDFFPAPLRARFDLVSWDPRGVGASTAVQCFATEDDEQAFFAGAPFKFFPVGKAEERAWIDAYARFGQLCAQRNGDLLAHVSTAESARDLDLLRQAVGDPQLTYVGISYGTFLGATYANLFPDKVRALVLDGSVDPVAWTNGGDSAFLSTFLRQESDLASAQVLDAFLTLCGQASPAQCAFSAGSAAATQAKWTTLLQRLREHPVTVGSPPQTYTYARLVTEMGETGLLFFVQRWTQVAELLQTLWTSSEPSAPLPAPTAATVALRNPALGSADQGPSAGAEERYAGPEQQLAIICAESPNPRHPGVFRSLAALAYARAGDVGLRWAWITEPCASWPATAADRYAGPWDLPTAHSILVIGTTFDPATPYEGAVAMANALARARLLTVDGHGHTALVNPNTCASQHVSDYLVEGTLPPEGTVCQQDQPPFTTGPSLATR
jgi:pimeloyl-ACP methyl ester carboxylesterase